MGTRDADYTRTGNSWLASAANKLSFLGFIPGVGTLSGVLLIVDGGLNAIGWALKGKFASAATAMGASTVAGVSSAMMSAPGIGTFWWAANVVSGVTTGRSISTHGRAATESATSFVTKPLGMQPTVLRSYYAGVGGINGAGMGQQQPGYWATRAANEKGVDPQARYNQYRNGEGADHMAALEASRAQGMQASRA